SSGTVFVLASNVAIEALKMVRKESISGLLYSGVGVGIISSCIFIFLFISVNIWKTTMVLIGMFSLIMFIFIIFGMRENDLTDHENHKTNESQSNVSSKLKKKFIWGFSIAYFCEGAGYIITGTFLVAIVKSIPSLSDYAALSWMFV